MSEQPITREQAIEAVKKWRDSWPDGIRSGEAFAAPEWNVHGICDFLLRELGEKKAVEPASYGEIVRNLSIDGMHRSMAAAVLRVVEKRIEPALYEDGSARALEYLAALAQARRPT